MIKRMVSVLVSFAVLFAVLVPSFSVLADDECGCGNSPIIYVIGRTDIFDDPESAQKREIPDISAEKLMPQIKELVPYWAKAVFLNQWEPFNQKTMEMLMPYFEGYAVNPDGTVTNGTGVTFKWSEDKLSKNHTSDNPYTYKFEYDARISPMVIADDMNDYIEAVKRVTGHSKVSIICRCVGVNYAFAYLYKYQEPVNYAGLDSLILYNASLNGIELVEDAFSGKIDYNNSALGLFLDNLSLSTGNALLDELLPPTIEMINNTYGIKVTAWAVQNFYNHIKDTLVVDFMRQTFGTSAGWFSMVNDNYEEAKDYIFCKEGDEETYSVILDQIDDFHYNVQVRAVEMIEDMQSAGIDVYAICKYGATTYPFTERNAYLNDNPIGLKKQSFGATCSKVDSTLGRTYIAQRTAEGYGKYISPDGQVDASTGLLPDKTWYIKFYPHNSFYDIMNPLLNMLCRGDNITVDTDENWSQFLVLEDRYKHPAAMTAENCDPEGAITHDGDDAVKSNIFTRMSAFIKWNITVIRILVNSYLINKES
ncbi:MAG: hypothetical protein IJU45_07135 [Clostridia bacterium]|nr:hypothetical protein [Clostridia bacterium]